MPTSWLMLVLAAAVAPWPLETPSVPPDAPEELYARLETMNPPARQAWVQAMLTRLDRANQVFLDPWEVRRQHARVETAMQPFVEGKPDWRRRAEFLNHELRVGQQAAVEHLSRQYRVEIYNNYRFSRPEYNRRRAALAQLIDQWTDAGALPGQEYKVVDWLLSAAERSAAAGALPPIPSFAPEPLPATSIAVAEPPKAQPAAPAPVEPKPAPPVAVAPPPKPPTRAAAEPLPSPAPRVADSGAVRQPAVGTKPSFEGKPSPAAPAVAIPTPVAPAPPYRPEVAPAGNQPSTAARQPAAPLAPSPVPGPPRESPSPAPVAAPALTAPSSTAGSKPSAPPSVPVTKPPVPSDVAAWSLPTPFGGSPRAFTPGAPAPTAFPSTPKAPAPAPKAPTPSPIASIPAPKAPAPAPNAPAPSPIASSPAPKAPTPSPIVSTPAPTAPVPSAVVSTPAPMVSRPAPVAPLQPDASPSKPRARVNLDELAAQVKGNNQALRLLSAELDAKKTWDAAQLATAIETLEPLVIRKDDLTTACDLLSPDELSRVGQPDSPAAIIADVAAKISAAQKRIEKGEFSGTQSQRQTELEMLDALSRKLKSIVFDHP